MLTKADIDWIKRNRAEVTQNRTDSVIIYHKVEIGEDLFTGDIDYEEVPETVEATWLRYTTSSSRGNDDRRYVNGVIAEVGDVLANFDVSVDLSDVETVKHIDSDELWKIRGVDKIGLGDPNRYYVLLGRVV